MLFQNNYHNKRIRVFVSGLPKAGTHLVTKCLKNLAGLKDGRLILSRGLAATQEAVALKKEEGVMLGVDDPVFIKKNFVESVLNKLKNNRIASGHVPYSVIMENIFSELGYRGVAIIRDPRDVVVSHVYYLLKEETHYLHEYYRSLEGFEQCLMKSILGFQNKSAGLRLCNISERFKGIENWRNSHIFHLTRFEDLIGSSGGGCAKKQEMEIFSIAEHLGISATKQKVLGVVKKMFGGTHSFRNGTIGGWREVFKEQHKEAFKEIAGDILIKSGYEKDINW